MKSTASRTWAVRRRRTLWWRRGPAQVALKSMGAGPVGGGVGMKKISARLLLSMACVMLASTSRAAESNYAVKSPDGRIEVRVHATDRVKYDVLLNGKALLQDSTLSINVDHNTLGANPRVTSAKERTVNQVLEPVIRQKFAKIHENYNEIRLEMEGGYAVTFRAYNEGAAYRLETTLRQSEVKIYSEEANFAFAGDYNVYYPQEESFFSHNERRYVALHMKEIAPAAIASLPAVVDAEGVKVAITESDAQDYPSL